MPNIVQTTQVDSVSGIAAEQKSTGNAAWVLQQSMQPAGATSKSASSGNVANATAAASLGAVASRTNSCSSISLDIGGATAGSIVLATLTGVIGGPLTFPIAVPTGATLVQQFSRTFSPPLQATAANVAIALSCPAAGLGSTNAAANITGYDQT